MINLIKNLFNHKKEETLYRWIDEFHQSVFMHMNIKEADLRNFFHDLCNLAVLLIEYGISPSFGYCNHE